jgi:hypothetical protein
MKILLAVTVGVAILGAACVTLADQPHMQAALQSLGSAQSQLRQATHDKGGHRARAAKLVEQAMAEVRAGIEFDRTHISPGENRR